MVQDENGTTTITLASSASAYRPGQRIHIVDTRRWWKKFWHWIIGKPKPDTDFIIKDIISNTSMIIEIRAPFFCDSDDIDCDIQCERCRRISNGT